VELLNFHPKKEKKKEEKTSIFGRIEWNLILIFTHLILRRKTPNIWFNLKWNLSFTQEKNKIKNGSIEWNLIFTHTKKLLNFFL
jgi:hypothetical protein